MFNQRKVLNGDDFEAKDPNKRDKEISNSLRTKALNENKHICSNNALLHHYLRNQFINNDMENTVVNVDDLNSRAFSDDLRNTIQYNTHFHSFFRQIVEDVIFDQQYWLYIRIKRESKSKELFDVSFKHWDIAFKATVWRRPFSELAKDFFPQEFPHNEEQYQKIFKEAMLGNYIYNLAVEIDTTIRNWFDSALEITNICAENHYKDTWVTYTYDMIKVYLPSVENFERRLPSKKLKTYKDVVRADQKGFSMYEKDFQGIIYDLTEDYRLQLLDKVNALIRRLNNSGDSKIHFIDHDDLWHYLINVQRGGKR
eukprot:Pgem_evm1s20308